MRFLKFCLRLLGFGVSLAILWEWFLLGVGDRLLACKLCRFFGLWSNAPVQRDARLKR